MAYFESPTLCHHYIIVVIVEVVSIVIAIVVIIVDTVATVYARVRVCMRDVFAIYDKIFDPG